MAYGINDEYDKASLFAINNIVSQAPPDFAQGYPWFSNTTINSPKQCKAILATNTAATGVSFAAYSYGAELAGITNNALFSENIRYGITTGSFKWISYGGTHPVVNGSVYSNIRMPDGSTNGVMLQTTNTSANNGIYFDFPSTTFLQRGKMYTFSVWVACDNRESYPSSGKMRLSYFSNAPGSPTSYSQDFDVTTTPRRVSYTFVANNVQTDTAENVAIGNGSGSPPAIRLVLWGAQLIEGNTAGPYIPTSTQWNGLGSGIGSTSVSYGPSRGVYEIQSAVYQIPAQTSLLLNTGAFAVSTLNAQNIAPPSTLQIYGLY